MHTDVRWNHACCGYNENIGNVRGYRPRSINTFLFKYWYNALRNANLKVSLVYALYNIILNLIWGRHE